MRFARRKPIGLRGSDTHSARSRPSTGWERGAHSARMRAPWDLSGFAFLQEVVIEPNRQAAEKAKPLSEAGARAKVAVAWERLGRADAASRQYAKSVALTGNKDVAKWRWLGLETVDMWSKVQEQQSAAPAPAIAGDARLAR